MALSSAPVTVRVPATCANLGPGFDSLGAALAIYDHISAQVVSRDLRVQVRGEGAGELPLDHQHLVVATMLATFERLGERPAGLRIDCENHIPQARGLGSSSAAIVAGILLARRLVEGGPEMLDQIAVLEMATEIEGHPDNIAPCVLGGFTVAWTAQVNSAHAQTRALKLDDAKGIVPLLFVPSQRQLTAHARALLPKTVPLTDAAFNAARTAVLIRALTGTPDLLFDATEDRLHQKYRAVAMPETARLIAELRAQGLAATLSGAGPTVLTLIPDDQAQIDQIRKAKTLCPNNWEIKQPSFATEGAQVVEVWPATKSITSYSESSH